MNAIPSLPFDAPGVDLAWLSAHLLTVREQLGLLSFDELLDLLSSLNATFSHIGRELERRRELGVQ